MNNKAKFKAGPWKARQGKDTNWWFVVEDSEGRELGSGDGGFEEPEANLIAAAPELYGALQMVLDDPESLDGRPRTAAVVHAALAKARGES